jgi:hypothetical protein
VELYEVGPLKLASPEVDFFLSGFFRNVFEYRIIPHWLPGTTVCSYDSILQSFREFPNILLIAVWVMIIAVPEFS